MTISRLSDRSRRILAALVGEYVETGEPVASATLVRLGGFGLSSATVRNVLAALEEQGFVYQPHTSAGRVPTDLGYRCYVDMLLEMKRPGRAPGLEAQLLAQAGEPRADGRRADHGVARAVGGLAPRGIRGSAAGRGCGVRAHRLRARSPAARCWWSS